jgi:hypothetical protein
LAQQVNPEPNNVSSEVEPKRLLSIHSIPLYLNLSYLSNLIGKKGVRE